MSYYGKLPIVLLSETASGKEDSYNCRIAAWLLGHLGENITAEQIAKECFVSKSAVSRFCREVGFEDFIELKELTAASEKTFETADADAPLRVRAQAVAERAAESMRTVAETIDYGALEELTAAIRRAGRIACFGLLKAETAAMNLQSDLVMLGKNALTKVSFREQMDFLASAGEDDLIIIFSYKGLYFDYDLPPDIRGCKAGIWIVTGKQDPSGLPGMERLPVAGILRFSSGLDFFSHPYQLLAASSILAQSVAGNPGEPREEDR
jgi:hypothetical protein